MTIFIGLDLSLVSPGVAVHNTTDDSWGLYGFAQRVKERCFTHTDGATTVCLFPAIPHARTTNEERYEHIRHYIVDCMLTRLKPTKGELVVVGIECYAFGAKNSGSSYKLQELGGVVKHAIWKRFPTWSQVHIPPTQWKKHVLGNGRATKADTLTYIRSAGPCIHLLSVLGLVVNKSGDIPCPAQDLADAACIVLSLLVPMTDCSKKRKKRKRKLNQTSQGESMAVDKSTVPSADPVHFDLTLDQT
jgi:Holliday junction resolvasome RuvABC endonuclease subunit